MISRALTELGKTVQLYKDYYQYEEIQGMNRKKIETVPEKAFREAVAKQSFIEHGA